MKRIVVVLDVEPRDKTEGWAFFAGTLRSILERVLSTRFAKSWDYRFSVVSVSRIDQEA